ncbi:MAG: hypothetical protein O2975_01210 [Proteobacteria bacterium]|nr:hypothetical protein [Pseudomonadota bacterium]
MTMVRALASRSLIALALLCVPALAWAVGDVGIVAHVVGEVTYAAGVPATGGRPKPFMEVREGDRFDLAAGAQLRIVYFEGGRQETYAGPARLVAGAQQSALVLGAAAKVSHLPSTVQQKISQAPELIEIARLGRTAPAAVGARSVRLTPQQQAEVREARDIYRQLRASTINEDILPELYLYSVLQDHLLFAQMRPVVNEMARRQPGSEAVALMRDYVRVKTGAR